ncbi:MAG: DUF3160 domain-containing protein, partial [Candidatus Heimdallarchaeota archaeon]
KQSYTIELSMPEKKDGYIEPYPEVYARLASLVRLMSYGLNSRGLLLERFDLKLENLAEIFDKLSVLSIKELENKPLTEDELTYIDFVGQSIAACATFNDPEADPWVSETDDRMAIIADVHTDPNTAGVLEVATGDPYVIYVIVQDHNGKLRLTKGGTFSYYEFQYPMTDRLSDEEWHDLLNTSPPDIPSWINNSVPIVKIELIILTRLNRK